MIEIGYKVGRLLLSEDLGYVCGNFVSTATKIKNGGIYIHICFFLMYFN